MNTPVQWSNDTNRALTDEWQQLFRGRKTGDVVDFAGGKMTVNVNGDPTLESSYSGNWVSPEGQSTLLQRVGQGRDARANANKAIADYYNQKYGFTSSQARLNSNLQAGTATDTVGNLINKPQVAGIYDPISGQTSGTGPGYVAPIYNRVPNASVTSVRPSTLPAQPKPDTSVFGFGGTPAGSAQNQQNTAMVNALRQKPIRFAGFGMGAAATTPQAQNVNLTSLGGKKTPNGLFQSI